jgi:hypothetical protein
VAVAVVGLAIQVLVEMPVLSPTPQVWVGVVFSLPAAQGVMGWLVRALMEPTVLHQAAVAVVLWLHPPMELKSVALAVLVGWF